MEYRFKTKLRFLILGFAKEYKKTPTQKVIALLFLLGLL
jgi:hypothetical protein